MRMPLLAAVLSWQFLISDASALGVARAAFGQVGAAPVQIYTLTNAHGLEARVMTYGATLVSLKTPDRNGKLANIVLGFASLEPYLAGVPYFGATVGRYANRIAGGRFTLAGHTYQLSQNDGANSLHGGVHGFDKRLWSAQTLDGAAGPTLQLTYRSPAGEEGYPGELQARVTYRLGQDDTLSIDFAATANQPTPVNLANHAYFNLTGNPNRSIVGHRLLINADRFTPVNEALIPTGELREVQGTPFDFRSPQPIGARISAQDEQLRYGRGYDHNWVLNKPAAGALTVAAVLSDEGSGRVVEIRTTQPGLQFYSGNLLNGKPAGHGSSYGYRTGLCLETQHFPDSPNHPEFPATILGPGQTYTERTVLSFRAE